MSVADADQEREYLSRAKNGDRAAQAWLIEHHQDAVYRLAFRLCRGQVHSAEELAQEAFLKALRGLRGFRGEAGFATWIHRIIVNLHLNQQSSLRTRVERHQVSLRGACEEADAGAGRPALELTDPGETPEQRASRREQQALVHRALDTLDEERRTVLVLRDLQGYSYEEIADLLHLPVGTVRSRLFRGREELRHRVRSDHSVPNMAPSGRRPSE